ncbi:MAG: hypothetical protein KIC94_02985 [Clostridiales bacterium]|nr:hypothetical protein [uncultured Anaerosporobacter sp.]MBS5931816.1 hypothetical protein [Clostridiales bacterium]
MRKKKLYVVAFFTVVIIFSYFCYRWFNSFEVNNKSKLIATIEENNNVSDIAILKTHKDGNLFLILYATKTNDICIFICREDTLFKSRYTIQGSGVSLTNNYFGTYLYSNPNEAIIVVYGDNKKLGAYKYILSNGEKTYDKVIDNETFIIDVYRIPNGEIEIPKKGIRLQLLDKNNKAIY